MINWVLFGSPDYASYVNLDQVTALGIANTGTDEYRITALMGSELTNIGYLKGTWTTIAGASEAIRELTDGQDPASFGD